MTTTYFIALGNKGETIITTTSAARDAALAAEGCEFDAEGLRQLGLRQPGWPQYWACTTVQGRFGLLRALYRSAPETYGRSDARRWVDRAVAGVA